MPYSRGYYALTPPSMPVFVISLILALAAMLVHYVGISIPIFNAARIFDLLAIAYIILVAGVVLRRI